MAYITSKTADFIRMLLKDEIEHREINLKYWEGEEAGKDLEPEIVADAKAEAQSNIIEAKVILNCFNNGAFDKKSVEFIHGILDDEVIIRKGNLQWWIDNVHTLYVSDNYGANLKAAEKKVNEAAAALEEFEKAVGIE